MVRDENNRRNVTAAVEATLDIGIPGMAMKSSLIKRLWDGIEMRI
jgi:hypothetical protein